MIFQAFSYIGVTVTPSRLDKTAYGDGGVGGEAAGGGRSRESILSSLKGRRGKTRGQRSSKEGRKGADGETKWDSKAGE